MKISSSNKYASVNMATKGNARVKKVDTAKEASNETVNRPQVTMNVLEYNIRRQAWYQSAPMDPTKLFNTHALGATVFLEYKDNLPPLDDLA